MVIIKSDWWKRTFTPEYFTSYEEDLSDAHTNQQVEFVINNAGLKKTDKILDIGCGLGRHALQLAKIGYDVTGLDQSSNLIHIARTSALKEKIRVKFIKGDMRKLPFTDQFDVILSLFTTLGYFSYEDNKAVIREMARILKPDGRLIIDLYDYQRVVDKYRTVGVPTTNKNVYRYVHTYLRGNIKVHDQQSYDFSTQVEHTKRQFIAQGKRFSYDLFLTFYSLKQYSEMFQEAGLSITRVWGDFEGRRRTSDSSRTIILVRKSHINIWTEFFRRAIKKFKHFYV